MNQEILVSDEILNLINSDMEPQQLLDLISEKIKSKDFLIVDKEIKTLLDSKPSLDFNWNEFDKARVLLEKNVDKELYIRFVNIIKEEKEKPAVQETFLEKRKIKINQLYVNKPSKRDVQSFIDHYNARYKFIQGLLTHRQELTSLISINRLKGRKEGETCSIIGMLNQKITTKNGNILLSIEDPSGMVSVLVNKNKPDLFELAKELTLDEVIGITGIRKDSLFFVNNLVLPDIPIQHELKKCEDEVYAICLSDLHVGSEKFLDEDFKRFLKWIRGETGNLAQKDIADKIKYVFIVGDLVDGVGIYPGQENELAIKDVKAQYDACAELLSQIPDDKTMIICPGNHDAVRLGEPQPPFYEDFASSLYSLKNAVIISNPGVVNIHASDLFPGFDFLLYHGYSFDFFVANIDSIRNQGGYDRADLIMKFLLKCRHLAPTHTCTVFVPDSSYDPLIIKEVPDFFLTGHIHKTSVSNYRQVTLISGSCWQAKTAFQEKVGHHPEPSRVPIINLKTRAVKILKF